MYSFHEWAMVQQHEQGSWRRWYPSGFGFTWHRAIRIGQGHVSSSSEICPPRFISREPFQEHAVVPVCRASSVCVRVLCACHVQAMLRLLLCVLVFFALWNVGSISISFATESILCVECALYSTDITASLPNEL